ncbi:MAG TPA: diacylglycerol kinase family protein [Galbitalea sp.]|jgi:diacylglycerol kinase family enzyme|nr:diacylglycerol kinase family protein [Galbitalea sp.]
MATVKSQATPSRATGLRVAAVIYNPSKVKVKALKTAVKTAETDAGWDKTLWYETSVLDPGGEVARRALAAGANVVMAAGGDGTVRAVAESLRGTEVPLALLPSGTGNVLARNLGVTLNNLRQAVDIAFTGRPRGIDVGVVEAERANGSRSTHAFLTMAGLGLDAQMVANTNAILKARAGWIAYVDAIARSLRDYNSVKVRYSVDGGPTRSATVNTVIVGNCGLLPGNVLLLPDAEIDDGIFDIVAFRPGGFVGWVQISVKLFWENGVLRRSTVGRRLISLSREIRALRYLRGTELTLRLERPEEFELDGDPFGEAIALKAWVDHLGLRVMVPADAVQTPGN